MAVPLILRIMAINKKRIEREGWVRKILPFFLWLVCACLPHLTYVSFYEVCLNNVPGIEIVSTLTVDRKHLNLAGDLKHVCFATCLVKRKDHKKETLLLSLFVFLWPGGITDMLMIPSSPWLELGSCRQTNELQPREFQKWTNHLVDIHSIIILPLFSHI